MKHFKKISSILMIFVVFTIILSNGIIVNADPANEMRSYDIYDYFVELTNENNRKTTLQMEEAQFSDMKTDLNVRDHLTGKDLVFYPKLSKTTTATVSGKKGRVMYYSLGKRYALQGKEEDIYAVLCYSDGSPIYVSENDISITVSGKKLYNIGIYIYISSGADLQKLKEGGQNVHITASEKWDSAKVYDITKSQCMQGKNLTSLSREQAYKLANTVNKGGTNTSWKVLTNKAFKWRDFVGDNYDGKCRIAFYNFGTTYAIYYSESKIVVDTNKTTIFQGSKPSYMSSVQLSTSSGKPLTKMIVAGVYAGVNKDSLASLKTNAWEFNPSLVTSKSFKYEKSNTSKSAMTDIKQDEDSNKLLANLFKITVPGKYFNERGYWYLALDYVLGDSKNLNTQAYTFASYELGLTKRIVIGVKKEGEKDLTASFTNRSEVNPDLYAEDEDDIIVRIDLTGKPDFSCKIKMFDIADINEDKIKNGVGEEKDIVVKDAKALFSAESNNLKFDKENNIVCDVNNFEVKDGDFRIPISKTNGIGEYYVEISAKEKSASKYVTVWCKFEITEEGREGIGLDDEEGSGGKKRRNTEEYEESTYGERSAIEANRELTFEEERKIDNINKANNDATEYERWSWIFTLLALCGIIVLIYSILLIVVYYVDLFNSVTEVSIYHKLTFGNMYPVGSANNIEHLNINKESKARYATHKTAWGSFVLGVFASAILLNGRMIVALFIRLVNWFSEIIKNT